MKEVLVKARIREEKSILIGVTGFRRTPPPSTASWG